MAVVLLVAACAEQPSGEREPDGGGDGFGTGADPVGLLGSWILGGVTGEDGSVVRLALGEIEVGRDCGTIRGSWRANSYGLFVAYIWSGDCGLDVSTPEWLSRATSFDVDGVERLLLDVQGNVTARLLPADEPTVVTDEARQALAPAAPLPPALEPVRADALTGRWVPAGSTGGRPETPHVELAADGSWRGSDGCNADSGRWVAGPDGALLAVGGAITLVGCDNIPVGGWLAGASRAGFDADLLVLLDAEGEELGRLRSA